MKNKLTTQQKWFLAIAGIILLNLAVWFYGLAPSMRKVDVAKENLLRAEAHRDSLVRRLQQLEEIDTVALEEEMNRCSVKVPNRGQLSEFITYLEDLAAETGAKLTDLRISEPAPLDKFLKTAISFSISGQYSQAASYILALEEYQRMLFIEQFSLEGSENSLTNQISLVIFAEDFNYMTPFEAPGRSNPFKK